MSEAYSKPHNLILDCRKKLSLTGVCDVSGFNEEAVNLVTSMGSLFVRGEKLHIDKLDLDSGEVEIEGVINSLQYIKSAQKKSLIGRLFS